MIDHFKARMLLSLKKTIEKWLDDKNCDNEFDCFFGNNIIENMADAAISVLWTNIELDEYLRKENLLKK